MISVIIPAKNEPYLQKTVDDVCSKALGEIEVLVADEVNDTNDMRQKINQKVKEAQGEYIMKLDAHCLVDQGFDLTLLEAHQPNWVQVPRRLRLDAENWSVIDDGREPVDYEFIIFSNLMFNPGFIWATPWDDLTQARKDIAIDDTPHIQGSCWFMTKEWFTTCGFMDEQYGGFAQEAEEIVFTTLSQGGKVKVNKNTYYAHLHKDQEQRKLFTLDSQDLAKGFKYSFDKWVRNRAFFKPFIKSYPPMPGWPEGWERMLWT